MTQPSLAATRIARVTDTWSNRYGQHTPPEHLFISRVLVQTCALVEETAIIAGYENQAAADRIRQFANYAYIAYYKNRDLTAQEYRTELEAIVLGFYANN